MAKSISDEELQLRKRARRRLIGAIALVTLTAAVLPMVLDTEPKPLGQSVDIQIPSPDAGSFTSKVVPLAPPTTPAPKEASKASAKPAAPETSKQQGAKTAVHEPQPAPPTGPAAEPRKGAASTAPTKAASAPSEKSAAAAKGFVVQVAALSDADKAKALHDKLTDNGIVAYTQIVKTAKGDVTRVRAGPFPQRAEAEQAAEKMKELGLKGVIAPQ